VYNYIKLFLFSKKKNQSVSIFKTEIAQLQTQENAWKNEMEFLQDKYTRNKTKKKWTILIEKTYYNIHTARFYEIYNQPPEVDLSFKLWLSKWQHRVAAG
jgi:uncharacterized protein YxjI